MTTAPTSPNPAPLHSAEEGEFQFRQETLDLSEVFALLRRRMWLILATIIAGCVATMAVVMSMTPVYESTAQVLIDVRENKGIQFEAMVPSLPSNSNAVDTQVEIMRSPALAQRVITQLSLTEDPEFNPELEGGNKGLLSWIPGFGSPAPVESEASEDEEEESEEERVMRLTIREFQDRISVQREGTTFVILVSFRSEEPRKASKIANAVADAYLVDQLEAKFEATERINSWLGERIETLREEVTQAELAVEQFRSERGLLAASGTLLNDQNLSQLNTQLIQARTNLAELRARLRKVRDLADAGEGIDTIAETMDSDTIRDLRRQQAEVIRNRAELLTRYQPRHPEVVKVNRELSDLNKQVETEIDRIVLSLSNEVSIAEERVRVLEENLEQAGSQNVENKQALVQLRQLERDADASRSLYEAFLSQFRKTAEGKTLLEADARIIARATPSLNPISPKPALALAVALAVSAVLGLGIALALEQLDRGFRDWDHVERLLGLPILASVPALSGSQSKIQGQRYAPQDFMLKSPYSGYAEAFRTLDACVWLTNVDEPPRSVLFTSSVPGEGKSTSALSYARSVAQSETSCILIDADLRAPSISSMLKVKSEAGLVDVLAGLAELDEAIIKDSATGLNVLTRGSRTTHPQDIFGSNAFDRLLEELCKRFDLVIFDSAPILPVADTRLLARKVDSCVLVLRWDKTPRAAASACVNYLRSSHARMAGILLEQVEKPGRQRDNYGDMRYYSGQYGVPNK